MIIWLILRRRVVIGKEREDNKGNEKRKKIEKEKRNVDKSKEKRRK